MILNVETHFSSITEFFKDLRQYQTKGSVNMYPTMLILIVFQIPCSLLNARRATESFALNRVSKILLQTFSTYIITIIMDRWFYIRRFVLGKLIFHLIFVTVFILQLMTM
ncbi:uncharacterized protein LOC112692997 [Sipha flava]|uniref:Uncharacterized protein LOC112692997 n=1 Tax=Sipha flava TaxID=143950 RepID=A0A8B8GKZ9_9HEMI|nr:uncharacterized protein LOC112692997 [Sipha flava]